MSALALVYRGKASRPEGCSEAVAALLADAGFDVQYVGKHEQHRLTQDVLAEAAVYAQPGGGSLGPAYQRMRKHRDSIRDYVAGGGRYLGFCLGGYLAGATPGFGLLPGDTDQYIATRGATVTHEDDTVVQVRWRDRPRELFFSDGAVFRLDRDGPEHVRVLARYPNGEIAALTAPFGAGAVGVTGPHPEATADWFADVGLDPRTHPPATDLGRDLIDDVMAWPTPQGPHGPQGRTS